MESVNFGVSCEV